MKGEKIRGTSPEGHARSVYKSVHQGWNYDMEFDTDKMRSDQVAEIIDDYLKNRKIVCK